MAKSSPEKIVIPVFNLFVKDLYFLHKIHTNHLPNGHVNFKVSSAPLWSKGRGAKLSQHKAGQTVCAIRLQGGDPGTERPLGLKAPGGLCVLFMKYQGDPNPSGWMLWL